MFKFFCLFLLIPTQFIFGNLVEDSLNHLSLKEKTHLSHFFRFNINNAQLGFVLFYDKPIALIPIRTSRCHYYPKKLATKGWLVWKKYEHLFPHKNFIFCEESPRNDCTDYFHLTVVNKTNLLNILTTFESDFKAILGDSFSPITFIQELENTKQLRPLIHDDEGLYGILMGYGSEAAFAYKRRHNNEQLSTDVFDRVPKINTQLKLHAIGGKTYIKTFGIHPVAWIANAKSEETQALQTKYTEQCLLLRQTFRKKNPLKDCLQQLTSPQLP